MLLHEITLDTRPLEQNKSTQVLGTGLQGIALVTKTPGAVRKIYGLDDLNDPYYKFIELIRSHQDNPFFPRIYKHKVYKDKPLTHGRNQWNMTGIVVLERLTPLLDANLDERVWLSLFHNIGLTYIRDPGDLSRFFKNRSRLAKTLTETNNKEFAEAVRVLLSMDRNEFDLHDGNWMVRLTSTGPQLVIVDPVFGEDNASGSTQF